MARRKNKKPVRLAALFKGLLPENFQQQRALIQQYQYFFQAQESDVVFQMVTVVNVTDRYLHVSVPNPALANYLRLHSQQIQQQIQHDFGLGLELKISARPENMHNSEHQQKLPPARHFSKTVCDQIKHSADSLEDDALKAALKSLSKTILKDSN